MSYQKRLQQAAIESGLTHRKLCAKCADVGVNISQGYLGMLMRGECGPASDKINKVLEQVLVPISSLKVDELYLLAYKEKIPAEALEKLVQQAR